MCIFHQTPLMWARKTSQGLRYPHAVKPQNLSLVPGTHTAEERTDSSKLPSDLHRHTHKHEPPPSNPSKLKPELESQTTSLTASLEAYLSWIKQGSRDLRHSEVRINAGDWGHRVLATMPDMWGQLNVNFPHPHHHPGRFQEVFPWTLLSHQV